MKDRTDSPQPPLPSRSDWNRRTFLAGLGAAAGAAGVTRLFPQTGWAPRSAGRSDAALLCVATFGATDAGTLHTLVFDGGRGQLIHTVSTPRPIALAVHPSLPVLYAANDVGRHEHEPRGSVEAVPVHPETAQLESLGRRPLSLSATRPRHLAVAPDGRSLLVAAFGGGAYNVLPLDASGMPGVPAMILKQVGCGLHPVEQSSAHPACVVFDADRDLAIAADYGADRLDLLAAEDGESSRMRVRDRVSLAAGSGPFALALHPRADLLAVAHRLRPSLQVFRVGSGRPTPVSETMCAAVPGALAFHPRSGLLYAALQDSLAAWHVDRATGEMRPAGHLPLACGRITALHATERVMWVGSEGGVVAVALDPESGEAGEARRIASAANVRAVAILPMLA